MITKHQRRRYTLTKFGFNADFKELTASNHDARADDSEGGCRDK